MPRWRPLPEELDPQIREFTSQLRRVVDRSGMSVATVADRTGYSKSSWERYLGGRLLPPRGATHALAEVTGTDVRHLETMWELAERVWSRSEMRHDVTMEAIQVAQARAALGEFGEEPARSRKRGRGRDKERDKDREPDKGRDAGAGAAVPGQRQAAAGPAAPPAVPGAGAPAGPAESDEGTAVLRPRPLPGQGPRVEQRIDPTSWRAVREPPPARPAAAPSPYGPAAAGGPYGSRGGAGAGAEIPGPAGPAEPRGGDASPGARHRTVMLLVGVAGALAVIGVALFVFGMPGGTDDDAGPAHPSPTRTAPPLPAGVKCQGRSCTGKDPEEMGCGGTHVKSTNSARIGTTLVEVRYSRICRAAWGRITAAAQGDGLKISARGKAAGSKVGSTNDAYTEMVAVSAATDARACATLVTGTRGCTSAASATTPTTPPAVTSSP